MGLCQPNAIQSFVNLNLGAQWINYTGMCIPFFINFSFKIMIRNIGGKKLFYLPNIDKENIAIKVN